MFKKVSYSIILLLFSNVCFGLGELPLTECKKHIPILTLDEYSKNLHKICREGYISYYDLTAKNPFYVSYTLTPDHSIGCNKRQNKFLIDDIEFISIPNDYVGTGYDKGHLSPAEDNSYSRKTSNESFYMSNIIPQKAEFNRGIWKMLEDVVRSWAFEGRSLQIVSGGLYEYVAGLPIIGDGVVVPSGFYKIIIDVKTKEYQAFYFSKNEDFKDSLNKHQVSLEDLEVKLHRKILSSENLNKKIKYKLWDFNLNKIHSKKKVKCSIN